MSTSYYPPGQLGALRRFAVALTVLTILGHAFLGFEQSYLQPVVAIATGYAMQILLEVTDCWVTRRRPRFLGGLVPLVDFLLAPHITALATAMLLYFNDQLWVVAFAVAVGVGSKATFRAPVGQGTRHVFNPSNFGITTTLLLFPGTVGLMIPWQFTEELPGFLDWAFVGFIFVVGSLINGVYTKRLPLIAGWLGSFVLQGVLRSVLLQHSLVACLAPATGVPALLFTFYMVPDPATTPNRPWRQVMFGASVGLVYGVLVAFHVTFALFIALTLVCAARGLALWASALTRHTPTADAPRKAGAVA